MVSSYHKEPVVGLVGALPLIITSALVPLVPAVPAVPELPFAPEVPELPFTPEVPELPEAPLVPLLPAFPLVPELPVLPEVPLEPFTPDVPELPACPLVPDVPDVPDGVIAYEADTALVDQLLVPNNDPVTPCVTLIEPLNIAGPIFVRVDEPDTVSEPVIIWLPTNVFDPVVANIL